MKTIKLFLGSLLMVASTLGYAAPDRDCVLEGTVKKQSADTDDVYVAFHSARPAEKGSSCRMRGREKLHFKAPRGSEIDDQLNTDLDPLSLPSTMGSRSRALARQPL